jgi:uncharacterized protein
MNCPKCDASMRSYERNGITIDQCTGCRGIFLDRGELEHLLDAEAKFASSSSEPVQQTWSGPSQSQPVQNNYPNPGYHQKKKKSFLSEFLDFD